MLGIVPMKLMHTQVVLIALLFSITRGRPAKSAKIIHQTLDRATKKEQTQSHETGSRLFEAGARTRSMVRKELVRHTEEYKSNVQLNARYQDLFRDLMTHWSGCNISTSDRKNTRDVFFTVFNSDMWTPQAKSGAGSILANAKPFVDFLLRFIRINHVKSMAEVSCGHWPSGWQSQISWPEIQYHGVDIVDQIVEENKELVRNRKDNFGLVFAEFHTGDMACDLLPHADLLLVKDTLQHLSFDYIKQFVAKNVFTSPRRYKYVMFVDDMLLGVEENFDIQNGGQRHLEMSGYPFRLPVRPAFAWKAGDMKKIVELLELDSVAHLDPQDVANVSQVRNAVYDYES